MILITTRKIRAVAGGTDNEVNPILIFKTWVGIHFFILKKWSQRLALQRSETFMTFKVRGRDSIFCIAKNWSQVGVR